LFRLDEFSEDYSGSFTTFTRETSLVLKKTAKNVFSSAANKISLHLPSHKDLIQRILPADFSPKEDPIREDFNQVWEEVYIHVYKLKESELGFYHTGIELHGVEFTFCENKGIVRHRPRKCEWGQFLGSIRLGEVNLTKDQTEGILQKMNDEGFSSNDYDVFEKSCNTFTEAFSVKLGLIENFPPAVHHQSRLGAMLAPLVRALEIATEKSSFDPSVQQSSNSAPAPGILNI